MIEAMAQRISLLSAIACIHTSSDNNSAHGSSSSDSMQSTFIAAASIWQSTTSAKKSSCAFASFNGFFLIDLCTGNQISQLVEGASVHV